MGEGRPVISESRKTPPQIGTATPKRAPVTLKARSKDEKTSGKTSGSEAVLYYSSIFLEQAGLTSVRQRLGGYILIGLCKLFPEAIVMLNVDKVGRKPLMIASSMGVTVIIAALGVIFLVDDGGDSGASSVSVVILLSLCKSLLQNADLPD